MLTHTIGFVGAGQMARALAQGFVAAKLVEGKQIVFWDPMEQAAAGFRQSVPEAVAAASNRELVHQADVIVLAVKPQHVADVVNDIAGTFGTLKLVISIAAGVTLARLAEGLRTERLVRVMPNTPALVGQGASAYALGTAATPEDDQLVGQLLSAVGRAAKVDEKLLDAVTGLSGSGPAFVCVMIEALADGGVRMGLPRDVALEFAAQTLRGTAELVLKSGEHPAALKDKVASPGGTTIAGLAALEERGLRGALIAAVEAATRRAAELGK